VALAAPDLLGSIKPARAAAFGALDALAVDHAGRGNGIAAGCLPRASHQREIDPPPKA